MQPLIVGLNAPAEHSVEHTCAQSGGGALIDVPGHPRLRDSIRQAFAARARNIVYVVDSKTFSEQSKENAE